MISSIRGRSPSTRRAVKALDTSRRSRVCSGGSVPIMLRLRKSPRRPRSGRRHGAGRCSAAGPTTPPGRRRTASPSRRARPSDPPIRVHRAALPDRGEKRVRVGQDSGIDEWRGGHGHDRSPSGRGHLLKQHEGRTATCPGDTSRASPSTAPHGSRDEIGRPLSDRTRPPADRGRPVAVTADRPEPRSPAASARRCAAYLDFHRETLARKCAGLADDDLRRRSTPSSLSLLGLVRHMAEVERSWFRRVVDGQDVPLVWSPDGDFQVAYDASEADPAGGVRRVGGRDRARPADRARGGVPGRDRGRPAVGRRVLAAPGDGAPDPGVRPAQRARRRHPRGDRRVDRRLAQVRPVLGVGAQVLGDGPRRVPGRAAGRRR